MSEIEEKIVPPGPVVWLVFTFDYPTEGKGKAPGALVLDSAFLDEGFADQRCSEMRLEHHEAWIEGAVLNTITQSKLISLEDGAVILHVAEEDIN